VLAEIAPEFGIEVKHAGDYHVLGKISEQVVKAIVRADVVFADANSSNENVWYEIGYADHVALDKVICLSRRDRPLPFDRLDVRSIQYDDTAVGMSGLHDNLRKMLQELLCDARLKLLLADPFSEESSARRVTEYLASKPFKVLGVAWLNSVARDSKVDGTMRRASLKALGMLKEVPANLLSELSEPTVDPRVRILMFERAALLSQALPQAFWDNAINDVAANPALLQSAMAAVTQHWLWGSLSDEWFRREILNNRDARIRQAALTALQKHSGQQ
jgi:hypothetical protein